MWRGSEDLRYLFVGTPKSSVLVPSKNEGREVIGPK